MANCLVGCGTQYSCDIPTNAIDHYSLAPYVNISFFNEEGTVITVGNNPSPQWDNTASIKSFETGFSNGLGMKTEIVDTMGSSFYMFVEKLTKCMKNAESEFTMGVQWGWVWTDCNGTSGSIDSPVMYHPPTKLSINFDGGQVKFNIESLDTMQMAFAARHQEIQGQDDLPHQLVPAIQKLATTNSPKFNVKFWTWAADGTPIEGITFQQGGKSGPYGNWKSDGQNKLSTITSWLRNYVTINNKGIIPFWNPSNPGRPQLDLVEDPTPDCNQATTCNNSLATYIVNGGPCSPVVSFNPKIDFVGAFPTLTTGSVQPGAAAAEATEQTKPCAGEETTHTGILQYSTIDDNARRIFGCKEATKSISTAAGAYVKAWQFASPMSAITAELKIQGDPREDYCDLKRMATKTLSLIVINPFNVFGTGSGCGDWLAQQGCNTILSNRSWWIKGCSHNITNGSYTTTLQLLLPSPGINLAAGESFGGPGSGGYVPTNTC